MLVLPGLAALVAAQRIYVIDGLNRAGTDFTDLPAAEAAAQHGDILDVRADGGPYSPIRTGKALTILGHGCNIVLSGGLPLAVHGLPAGRDFVLHACNVVSLAPASPVLSIAHCAGRVHLQRLSTGNYSVGVAVDIDGCAAVTVRDSRLSSGVPALRVRNSTVVVANSQIAGAAAAQRFSAPAGEGVHVIDARLSLHAVQVSGGNGDGPPLPPAPAMKLAGSVATVGSISTAGRLGAGFYGTGGGTAAVAAVVGQSSLLRIDPSVAVDPRGGAPAFVGVIWVAGTVSSLAGYGATVFSTAFQGDPRAVTASLVGLPADPTYGPGFSGSLWLEPTTMVAVPGVVPGFQTGMFPRGATVAMQVACVTVGGVDLSNVVIATVP